MKKYVPYLLAGIAGGLVIKYLDTKSGVNTTVPRPEEDTAATWWKFW